MGDRGRRRRASAWDDASRTATLRCELCLDHELSGPSLHPSSPTARSKHRRFRKHPSLERDRCREAGSPSHRCATLYLEEPRGRLDEKSPVSPKRLALEGHATKGEEPTAGN